MSREIITEAEHFARLKAQGVPRVHCAMVCPACGTVQSNALFRKHGIAQEAFEGAMGFSCIGRFTGAGPWQGKPQEGRPGCNWTLGGLFQIHIVEVEFPDGTFCPCFRHATAEEARALMTSLEAP